MSFEAIVKSKALNFVVLSGSGFSSKNFEQETLIIQSAERHDITNRGTCRFCHLCFLF